MSRMAVNQRRWPRVRAQGVAAHLRGTQGRVACQVENVSLGGLFVRTDHLEEVGTEIAVDLVRPGWKKQLTLTARVSSRVDALDGRITKRMPGLGMQFLKVDDKQFERLRQLLRELGAPDEEGEVTLDSHETEPELRAREVELDAREEPEPLDPQPEPQLAASSVEAEIESALREADLPPPGPVVLHDTPRAPPRPAAPEDPDAEKAKLTMQLRGLVMQLSDAQQQLASRDLEVQRLKDELETVRSALERALRKNQ
jgi:Tfp pilus assembly protein PilZ